MTILQKVPKRVLHFIHLPPQLAYAIGLGPLIGKMVLLLTTIGRKSGKDRVTPLQYEEMGGKYLVAAALGDKTDWYRNILANPQVKIHVKSKRIAGVAEIITDTEKKASFLDYRFKKHPRMVGSIMRADGVPIPPQRKDLLEYAEKISLVCITPVDQSDLKGKQNVK